MSSFDQVSYSMFYKVYIKLVMVSWAIVDTYIQREINLTVRLPGDWLLRL